MLPFFAFVALLLPSCDSGSTSKAPGTSKTEVAAGASAYDNGLAKGTVTDSVVCRQGTVNYALYLPSYYNSDKSFPCIYCFDAHARGSLPVNMYKSLAEKYGFILIGSNVSKNGMQWPVNNEGIKAMMDDASARIHIDAQRIYAAGFSGGSRVASSVAIFNGGIAGVLGCAAGFPSVEDGIKNKFDYFGIVGDYDFNLAEMEQLDQALGQNGFSHQLLTSGGMHGWAPAPEFETGLLWMQVNAMKENKLTKNDALIKVLKQDYAHRIDLVKSTKEWIKEQELLDGMIRILDLLSDVSTQKKQLADLVAGENYKKAVAQKEQLTQQETALQQNLAQQYTENDEKWWKAKIAELNAKAAAAKTKEESQMYKRVISYLGLVGYMTVSHALNTGDLTNGAKYLEIFKSSDPRNPDGPYLTAVYWMKKGDTPKAMSSLNDAVKSGYSEVATLVTNPVFSPLLQDPSFKEIIAKVSANNKAK